MRIEGDLLRRVVKIARLPVPLLSLSLVHREPDDMSVRSVEGFIPVQKGLDPVGSGRDFREAGQGISEDGFVDDSRLFRKETVDIYSKYKLGVGAVADLKSGLLTTVI
jgi:hypothetical protein